METNLEFLNKLTQGWITIQQVSAIEYQYHPRKLVYQHDKLKLYHYKNTGLSESVTPLLVVFATVNRPEILDLFPDHSLIGGFLKQGRDVYFLDWGYPDAKDQHISFANYVLDYLQSCVQFICEHTQKKTIHLLGICQGGLICLSYASLFQNIKNLILISTPIDFNTQDHVIAKMLKRINIDALVDIMGNISGAWLTQFFISLRPFELVGKKYLRFIDHLSDPVSTDHFLRVEKWLHDAPDQTGASFSELVKKLYCANQLVENEFHLEGKKIELSRLTMPILNVMAREDEIVPLSASRVLKKYVRSSDYSSKIFPSGHIGIYVSDKVGNRLSKTIADWLQKRD